MGFSAAVETKRIMQATGTDKKLFGKTILVAEDVEMNQHLIRHILESSGAQVVIARNGAEALEQVFKKKTVYMRSGGSIPVVGTFQKFLKAPSVMMGFGLPDDNLHAPNEKFHIPNFYRGIETVGRFLELLGQ